MLSCPKCGWVLSTLVIVACITVSFLYFANGFLLTRVELMDRAPQPSPDEDRPNPPFKRAVVILLDALRFDFLWSSISGKPTKDDHYYSGRLTAFAEAARDPGARTWFYEALADAPTTTMQRLKGITTGGLPTFIDIGSNFNSAAIEEDSWVEQAHAANKTITFMGDDTWMSLFPKLFDKSYPYPSFDVMDLHTVDNGVIKHLVPEIRNDANDLIIAHFLGVDHIGHRHGADHPVMADKLTQLNAVIKSVMQELPQDTLLMVLGDHGMTEDGNHGGASHPETSSGLVLYYKAAPGEQLSTAAKKDLVDRAAEVTGATVDHKTSAAYARTVYQIDLVPTLAKALGFQIPYGNLGMVLAEPFIDRETADKEQLPSLKQFAKENVEQIKSYIHAYANRVPSFASSINMPELDGMLKNKKKKAVQDDENADILKYYKYHGIVAESCRRLWASLDMKKMCWGMILACGAALMAFVYIVAAAKGMDEFPYAGVLYGLALGIIFSYSVRHWELPVVGNYVPMVACIVLAISVCFTIDTISHTLTSSIELLDTTWETIVGLVSMLLHALCMFSNSYEEAEDSVIRYFVTTLAALVFFGSAFGSANLPNLRVLYGGTWKNILLLGLVVRLSSLFSVHGQRFESLDAGNSARWVQELLFIGLSILPLAALTWLSEKYLWEPRRRTRAPQVMSNTALALVALYWFVSRAQARIVPTKIETSGFSLAFVLRWVKLITPHIVWALSGLSMAIVFIRGFRKTELRQTVQGTLGLFMPFGYGGFFAAMAVPIVMAMGPHAVFPIALMFVQICLVADLCKKLGYKSCVLTGILMAFTGIQYFYATGHTPQISDISFEAGFIGFEKTHWIIGFVLVLLNTVGAPLLCLLAIPLLRPPFKHYERHKWWLFLSVLSFWAVYLFALCGTTVFIFFEPRHLMIWRVFCPRLLFDAGMTVVYFIVAVLLILFISINKLRW